jgi:hypothetical protein
MPANTISETNCSETTAGRGALDLGQILPMQKLASWPRSEKMSAWRG